MKNKFILCGLTGWCLEIIWTGFHAFRRRDLKLVGRTSLWMFPIYGTAALLTPVSRWLKNRNALVRGGTYMIGIYTMEYISGILLKKHDICPWDYSKAKLNYKGVIRLDFAPIWFITGLFYEKILQRR